MINNIIKYSKKPELYAKSSSKFWDDEHISRSMLEAHLNPDIDAASRNHKFIDKSVEWISIIAPAPEFRKALDLGCGPGLYAERLHKKGYSVTGVDLSHRSIEYARQQATEKKQNISYDVKNYLDLEYENEFDLALLIYCDYAVLPDREREILLGKIYSSLKEGGKFIFDVFTPKQYEGIEESKSWYASEGGFWKPDTHICLTAHYIYENNTRLDQYVVIDKEDNIDVFRMWDHYFSIEEITKEVNKAGFKNIEIYSDVSGEEYSEASKTMCIVVEK